MKLIKTLFIGSLATVALCNAADKNPSPILTEDGKSIIIAPGTTTDHRAYVLYQKGENGFYNKDTMVCITDSLVISPQEISAFDTKGKRIIYSDPKGVYFATIKKELSKPLEKINELKKLKKDKEIEDLITELSQTLDAKMLEINANELKRQQAELDSINRVRIHDRQVKDFFNKRRNTWRTWEMTSGYKCDVCNETHPEGSSVHLVKITPTHWFYKMKAPGTKEWSSTLHSMKAPNKTEKNALFFEAFADSLKAISAKKHELPVYSTDAIRKKNELITNDAFRKSMPWGFVYNWSWDTNKGNVIFEVSFLNAADRTIKEIYFYTTVSGADKKPITNCLFKTVTPVPPGDYGYWRWDPSTYNVGDDASNMSFSKIVIVYTDGTKKTLSDKELKVFRK